jgi:LmbE family N-acetylglucosaminyl deacetylase
MTGGITGRLANPAAPSPEDRLLLQHLREDLNRAADVIGYASVTQFDFPDNRMDTVSRMDLCHPLRGLIDKLRPSLLFTHHPGDYNWDHTRTFDSVLMAARVNPPEFAPAEIRTFEVLSSTERAWQAPSRAFLPNLYEDVGGTIDKKKLALTYYRSEYRAYPHGRSIEAVEYQSRLRGVEAGVLYAEAFHLIRRVES